MDVAVIDESCIECVPDIPLMTLQKINKQKKKTRNIIFLVVFFYTIGLFSLVMFTQELLIITF